MNPIDLVLADDHHLVRQGVWALLEAEPDFRPEQLSIRPRTVEVHRASMMHKLGLKTPTDLIRYTIRRGIISNHY